ncbi:hypothetical protein MPTK1_1g16530 [Marchantia polymorpha subsp. ruderalis]|uniref:Uncharacterized protein n=2 Tax=Marchantia polymorpha TaxID=3197 RepID=A0AAF6AQV0_MARPO|nr:hypothetical protein MARPO_0033s0007 [Marchantia polymorpha]BBM98820.1 hypothetical protein Mp_1g16530 [Marchantia polymorpha subsp. ruderalis]|eukprot:PTQ41583.1 hypothetical protein MARPO_0033s0007 [Marchantia polymorpha]
MTQENRLRLPHTKFGEENRLRLPYTKFGEETARIVGEKFLHDCAVSTTLQIRYFDLTNENRKKNMWSGGLRLGATAAMEQRKDISCV